MLKLLFSGAQVSRKLGWLYSEMIFSKGFVHCDPHPGNVLVRKKAGSQTNGVEIVLLDHGLYHVSGKHSSFLLM